MAWNPFRAIGNAIGRVFGRGESQPGPQERVEQQPPEPQERAERQTGPQERVEQRQPEPQEERGFLGRILDRVTGADRERQLEERQRQLEERERQLVERERQIEVREQAAPPVPTPALEQAAPPVPTPAPEQAAPPVPTPAPEQAAPPVPTPAPEQAAPAPERELPKFAADASDYLARDERAFGTDSELGRELDGAVADFIADRGGLDGLSVDAREWLQTPTISEPFSDYWQSGGFTADQVLAGMTNITNIQIKEGDDGEIHIEFDYDAEVDGYEVHGHASS